MKNSFQHAGFTLLEIMVAVSIISIVFISIFKLHMQTITMSTAAGFYTTAPLLAQKKLAELEVQSSEELNEDSGNFGDEFLGYSWQVSISDIESEVLGETAKDFKKIDVTVSFNNEENTYLLRTYRLFWD